MSYISAETLTELDDCTTVPSFGEIDTMAVLSDNILFQNVLFICAVPRHPVPLPHYPIPHSGPLSIHYVFVQPLDTIFSPIQSLPEEAYQSTVHSTVTEETRNISEEGIHILTTEYSQGSTGSLYAESDSGASVPSQQGLGRLAQDSNGSYSAPFPITNPLPSEPLHNTDDDNEAYQYHPHSPTLSKFKALFSNGYDNRLSSPTLSFREPPNVAAVRAAVAWREFDRLQVTEQNERVITRQTRPFTLTVGVPISAPTIIHETMGPAQLSHPKDHHLTPEWQQQTIEQLRQLSIHNCHIRRRIHENLHQALYVPYLRNDLEDIEDGTPMEGLRTLRAGEYH
ncbi:hypothetical protein EV421DRAFT_1914364 [Armillaria borealis]|uniref:Uncharacterized protein n=1 Tax=Armillaria borealis TaxID=47425 RepID=A0AA39ISE2_9AGAR|nr:hypothetical protein EV421DRAFT_1914364 [Armillaria borealis]